MGQLLRHLRRHPQGERRRSHRSDRLAGHGRAAEHGALIVEIGLEKTVLRKITWRLIPFLFVLYIFNYLDRTNVGVAGLTMKTDLRFSDQAWGWGLGIFFLGYF